MPKLSAGLLLYRIVDGVVEVLIAHPGGPFWARKDEGAWSFPKGEYGEDEDPWAAAQREFAEELGKPVPPGDPQRLDPVRQSGGKVVTVFAVHGDLDLDGTASNTFNVEWPKGSGNIREYPEVDRTAWLPVAVARAKLLSGQRPLLDQLMALPALAGHSEGVGGHGESGGSRSR
ncbi:NUDIX domain-containing protein [Mycolicibacterium sp. S2-37]|uniref:NUDIX domain-containing protein n=1 Tax=Mycolicibacterium sp. S2-37 TaxID=2810297 RepID=UPI001A93D4BE|nr:NUDIX domain-containing protein [Mycolicibacterium sp. S2-37]MBO0675945.1 NUDIX domain-containing protein [Mycolicibacterium sp. S2-37]